MRGSPVRIRRRDDQRAMAAGVPSGRVALDTIYGVGEIEMALTRAGKGYVLGANATHGSIWSAPGEAVMLRCRNGPTVGVARRGGCPSVPGRKGVE